MTVKRAIVTIPSTSAIPRDIATNTWHFFGSGDNQDVLDQIEVDLNGFYHAIDGFLSSACDTTATVKVYNLGDNPPRVPEVTFDITLVPDNGNNLPPECAICLSYRGSSVSGIPQARRRGRIFLGPLSLDVATNSNDTVVVTDACRDAIAAAADGLAGAAADPGSSWAVFSPTSAGVEPWSSGDLIAGTSLVVAGYVDNAFDTIRSRGTAATDRSVFP